MADILIRGMEMPENCTHCRFAVDGWCYAYGKPNIPALAKAEVSNFCPLIPLPDGHGRLIDGDALYEVAKTRSMGIYGPCDFQCVITGNDILKAHTIVPAEGGTDDGA